MWCLQRELIFFRLIYTCFNGPRPQKWIVGIICLERKADWMWCRVTKYVLKVKWNGCDVCNKKKSGWKALITCFYIQSNLTEHVGIEPRVSVCVCLSVYAYLCVCVISTAHTNKSILMKLSTNDLEDICQRHNGWRHGGHFVLFSFRHSNGRNLLRFS